MILNRKPRTPDELAPELARLIFQPEQGEWELLPGVPPEIFRDEMRYLAAFAVDLAVLQGVPQEEQRMALLDAYYAHLEALLPTRTGDARAWDRLRERLHQYAECLEAPHPVDPAHALGELFARLCRHPGEDDAVAFAVDLFENLHRQLTHLFQHVAIRIPPVRPKTA